MHSKKEKTGWFFPSIRANVLTNMGTAPGFQQAQKQNKKKTQPTFPSLCSSFWTKKETRFSIILTCKCQPARNQSIYLMLILVEMTLLYVRSMGRRDTGTFSLGTLRKKENRDRHNLKYKTLSFFSFYFRDSIRLSFSIFVSDGDAKTLSSCCQTPFKDLDTLGNITIPLDKSRHVVVTRAIKNQKKKQRINTTSEELGFLTRRNKIERKRPLLTWGNFESRAFHWLLIGILFPSAAAPDLDIECHADRNERRRNRWLLLWPLVSSLSTPPSSTWCYCVTIQNSNQYQLSPRQEICNYAAAAAAARRCLTSFPWRIIWWSNRSQSDTHAIFFDRLVSEFNTTLCWPS